MNNKLILIAGLTLLSALAIYSASQDTQLNAFQTWKSKHNKFYTTTEELYRAKVFNENLQFINAHNSNANRKYTMEANKFADLTLDEFVDIYLSKGTQVNTSNIKLGVGDHPPMADWARNMNPVKNQGQCGSCWTFSAVGAVEAYWIITQNFKGVLSEQQLVDCAKEAGDGCNGGNSDDALDYVAQNGLVYESDYPYKAEQGVCRVNKGKIFINGREDLKEDEDRMKSAIADYPISVSVDATNWRFYKEGIFSGDCRDDFHNHAVVAVGYDYNENWKIRNSWGPDYGQAGHIWLAPGNTCAVMTRADRAI